MPRGYPVEPGGAEYTADQSGKGVLWGSVTVVDRYQQRLLDKSGVIVTIDGTPLSTITTESGYWEFQDLPEGEYTITWTKPEFGFSRKVGIKFSGVGSVHGPKPQITQIPDFSLGGMENSSASDVVRLTGAINGTPTPISFGRFYVGRSPTVSYRPQDHDTSFARQLFVLPGNSTTQTDPDNDATLPRSFAVTLSGTDLRAAGFPSGSVLYLIGYTDSPQPQSYVDPQTKRRFYTTVNVTPSNVVRMIVP